LCIFLIFRNYVSFTRVAYANVYICFEKIKVRAEADTTPRERFRNALHGLDSELNDLKSKFEKELQRMTQPNQHGMSDSHWA